MGKILKGKEQLTLAYGYTGMKIDGKPYDHFGIDVVKQWWSYDTVIAYEAGTVTEVRTNVEGYNRTYQYGNYVIIKHDNGYVTWYAHLSRVDVKVGQKVKKGQSLGYMGATGLVTGAHLHFEIHKDGKRVNPYDYVFGNKTFAKPAPKPTKPSTSKDETYIVKKGDTLSAIASKYGTTYQELAKLNRIANPDHINIGQIIRLPKKSTPVVKPKESLLIVVKKTIRGDYGNMPGRKTKIEKTGHKFVTVQAQVEANYRHGTTAWSNIKLY